MDLYPTMTCSSCFGTFDREAFFRRNVADASATSRQFMPRCVGCELTARTRAKIENRVLEKARTTRTRHAARLSSRHAGSVLTGDEFGETFGWHLDRMVADIEAAEAGVCCYCERPFSEMPHELAAITLDIVDPAKMPYYRTNTHWCCATCNTEKSHLPPELWERRLMSWRQWNARQALPAEARGMLFDLDLT